MQDFERPERIGPHHIGPEIGRGPHGITCSVRNDQTSRLGCITWLAPDLAENPLAFLEYLRRFRAEHRLDIDRIEPIVEFGGIDEGHPFVRMSRFPLTPLIDQWEGSTPAPQVAIQTTLDLCRALSQIHESGLFPSRLVLAELWLDARNSLRIPELALVAAHFRQASISSSTKSTDSDLLRAVDLFLSGKCLYLGLTSRRLAGTRGLPGMLGMSSKEPPPRPCALRANLPRRLDALTFGALGLDENQAPKDLEEMAQKLREIRPFLPSSVRILRPFDPAPRNYAFRNLIVGMCALALIGGVLLFLYQEEFRRAIQDRPDDLGGIESIAPVVSDLEVRLKSYGRPSSPRPVHSALLLSWRALVEEGPDAATTHLQQNPPGPNYALPAARAWEAIEYVRQLEQILDQADPLPGLLLIERHLQVENFDLLTRLTLSRKMGKYPDRLGPFLKQLSTDALRAVFGPPLFSGASQASSTAEWLAHLDCRRARGWILVAIGTVQEEEEKIRCWRAFRELAQPRPQEQAQHVLRSLSGKRKQAVLRAFEFLRIKIPEKQ